MVELFEGNLRDESGSSKGNQLKWLSGEYWYKADYAGYEGLSEYVCSEILRKFTTLDSDEVVEYSTTKIRYKSVVMNGCVSRNILRKDWQLITIERLVKQKTGRSIGADIYKIESLRDRLKFLEESVVNATGIVDFGKYLAKAITIDALFLNEDRHTHNIAVLLSPDGQYHCCPFFDHGASLMSDTTLDYPLGADIYELIKTVKAKTICRSFDEALEVSEILYGVPFKFQYSYGDVEKILSDELCYPQQIKDRIAAILMEQRRKYKYLFF